MICVDDLRQYEKQPPEGKLLTLAFAAAAREEATEVRFDFRREPPAFRMWYWVEDQAREMVPPPEHMWPDVVRRLHADTRAATGKRRPWWGRFRRHQAFPSFPLSGLLPVRFGGTRIDFDILFFRGRTAEHIWVEKRTPLRLKLAADWFFHQWQMKYGPRLAGEGTDSDTPSADPEPGKPAG